MIGRVEGKGMIGVIIGIGGGISEGKVISKIRNGRRIGRICDVGRG